MRTQILVYEDDFKELKKPHVEVSSGGRITSIVVNIHINGKAENVLAAGQAVAQKIVDRLKEYFMDEVRG